MGPSGPGLPLNPNPDLPGNPPSLYIQPGSVPTSTGGGERPLGGIGFLAAAAPALPLPPSSPVSSSAPWRAGQAADERNVEMEMRERLRSRPRDRAREVGKDRTGNNVSSLDVFSYVRLRIIYPYRSATLWSMLFLFYSVIFIALTLPSCFQPCENILHPFLQQETGHLKVSSEVEGKEVLFTQVSVRC